MNGIRFIVLLGLGMLLLAACSSDGDPVPGDAATADPLQGIVWQWLRVTEKSSGDTTTVPNPENYTLSFNDDGTFSGMADCNAIGGTYSQDSGFTITVGPSTTAFCGEESMDQQFLQLLGNVAAGGPDGAGGLALESAGGAERMEFANGGAAE